jgi:hypothetical protein
LAWLSVERIRRGDEDKTRPSRRACRTMAALEAMAVAISTLVRIQFSSRPDGLGQFVRRLLQRFLFWCHRGG